MKKPPGANTYGNQLPEGLFVCYKSSGFQASSMEKVWMGKVLAKEYL